MKSTCTAAVAALALVAMFVIVDDSAGVQRGSHARVGAPVHGALHALRSSKRGERPCIAHRACKTKHHAIAPPAPSELRRPDAASIVATGLARAQHDELALLRRAARDPPVS